MKLAFTTSVAAACLFAAAAFAQGQDFSQVQIKSTPLGNNTYMLEGIDKAVIRGPLRARPTPVWFSGNQSSARLGPRLVDIQAKPAWWKMPGVLFSALGG